MWTVKTTAGTETRIGDGYLHRLRMWADWQIRAAGYDPVSVNEACRTMDDLLAVRPKSEPDPEDPEDADGEF
jgi:hypothetical protein